VVLVGGGDMLLSPGRPSPAVAGRAGLDELAAEVAANLTAAGQGRVAVRFDDSLFAGPNTSPAWGDADVAFGYTGRVAALGLASDRARPGRRHRTTRRQRLAAAFAAALRRTGVEVAGTPARARASEGAEVLGEVASAPLSAVLGLALTESDNALSDGLARLVAQARQRPTTSASAADAVLEQVQELGVDVGSSRITDASGLGRGSLVAARVLGDVLTMAAGPDQPRLRPMLDQLPVAGFTGTLTERYTGSSTRRAAGTVRAKTGTLTGATALAGTVVNRDGRLLVLVLMADRVPATGTLAARASVDRVAAALAACGCR
jgi:D-alanyl-D-alanine carboxypeptidase/D-alanyl-D-alanine-endopeptidase (penicillin-binding protein 4)